MAVTITPVGPVNALRNAASFYDIDETRDDYLQYLKKEYAINIPDYIAADKRLLYKYIKDFYQSKGTEKSFQFLFRIFFDEEVELKYPAKNMLRTSDGKWKSDKSIKVLRENFDPYTSIGQKITGNISGASAVVDSVTVYQDGENQVHELLLVPGSLFGRFDPSDLIEWGGSSADIYSVLGRVTIVDGGTGYSEGQVIHDISTPTGSSGTAVAKISAVGELGEIQKVDWLIFGSGYNTAPTIDVSGLGDGNAVLTATTDTVCEYAGYYVGVDGQLSENIKLQDSWYYQAYSYVIRSGRSINTWRDIVKQIGHPAGYALFGETVIRNTADISGDENFISTIHIDRVGVTWTNNSSQVIPWFNKYNNQVTWANS